VYGNTKVDTKEFCAKKSGSSQEVTCVTCPGRDGTLLDLAKQQDCAAQKAFNYSDKCIPGMYLSVSILTVAGNYISTVQLQNISLPNSPLTITVVPAAPYALLSTLHSDQLYVANADKNHLFLISSADIYGNVVASAASGCSFRLDALILPTNNPVGFALSEDVPPVDGIFNVRFQFTYAGKYSVSIMVLPFMQPIRGSPFDVLVKSGTFNASTSYLQGAGVSIATAGLDQTFTIVSKDRYSNIIKERIHNVSGDIISVLQLEQDNITLSAFARETFNGTFTIKYQATKSGIYQLTASLRGVNFIGIPSSVLVVPGKTSASQVIVFGEGLKSAAVDTQATFQIRVSDMFGNKRSIGGDIFRVVLSGGWTELPDGDQKAIETSTAVSLDKNDGSYLIMYLLTRSGNFNIDISVFERLYNGTARNTPVHGSPFTGLTIDPGVMNGRLTVIYGLANSSKAEDPKIAYVLGKDLFGNPADPAAQSSIRFSTNLQFEALLRPNPTVQFLQSGIFAIQFSGKSKCIETNATFQHSDSVWFSDCGWDVYVGGAL
jgi:hypothetical protein